MPLGKPAPPNKRKNLAKIITDLTHVTQDEYESDPEAELDLGTKIRTPKDIMLEELSLQNNKGSKMFRMRQKRVDRFIYENNPDIFSSEAMDDLQKFVPSLGGQMRGDIINVGGHFVSKQAGLNFVGMHGKGGAPVPPPKPGSKGAGAGTGAGTGAGDGAGAGGQGGGDHGKEGGKVEGDIAWSPLKGGGSDDVSKTILKLYVSPWEKAMKGDEILVATMKGRMAGPCNPKDLCKYKSFNRSAMPFGGFEKANQFLKFQMPEPEAKEDTESAMVYQHEIGCRPSFNRTPIGWVGNGEPGNIHMETDAVPFDGETDEL